MGRMYALDNKLICGSPEIKIGDRVFAVDDRQKTVRKMMALFEDKAAEKDEAAKSENREESFERMDKVFELAFGKKYKEIESMELSFAASNELLKIVIAAATGEELKEDEEDEKSDSFRSDGEVV